MWQYTWNANGSLKSVKKPSGQTISFEYDALGRRTAKRSGNKEILYIWSGNVLLHEVLKTNDNEQVITWVYEQGSFVPTAKLINGESFSIVSDYIGRPIQVYDQNGDSVWSADYDIYGKLINLQGDKSFIPFRQLGQYEDVETGLYYNRFRYYDCNTGTYISQDPIGLSSGEYNFYAYVHDVNGWVDIFGLTRGKRVENLPKSLQRRPKWRKKTYEYLYKNNPRTEDGKYISVKTQKVIEPGNEVIGHQNQSWREYQEAPENQTKTRKQVIEDYNDVTNLGFEDKRESSSDGGKYKGHEH